MTVIAASVEERLRLAKDAAREIALLDSARKSVLLNAVADAIADPAAGTRAVVAVGRRFGEHPAAGGSASEEGEEE